MESMIDFLADRTGEGRGGTKLFVFGKKTLHLLFVGVLVGVGVPGPAPGLGVEVVLGCVIMKT